MSPAPLPSHRAALWGNQSLVTAEQHQCAGTSEVTAMPHSLSLRKERPSTHLTTLPCGRVLSPACFHLWWMPGGQEGYGVSARQGKPLHSALFLPPSSSTQGTSLHGHTPDQDLQLRAPWRPPILQEMLQLLTVPSVPCALPLHSLLCHWESYLYKVAGAPQRKKCLG